MSTARGGVGEPLGPGDEPLGPSGESVCWLGRLCPECGAMPEGEAAQDPTAPCWRCGALRERPAEGATEQAPGET